MDLSDDPNDKLRACLNHGWPDPDLDFSPDYLAACQRWFEVLPPRARNTAVAAIAAYGRGDEIAALELAGVLPLAPRVELLTAEE
ncbi:MAG TPA: hypothetical protein VLV76_19185 [Candidatus Acidoferrum sp.]|nr:hypothetical protein [Candidatus Acidoferrum sp.]